MKNLFRTLALCLSLTLGAGALAAERGTADEAVAMVHKVIADMKANGKDKTIAEINTLGNRYRDRDLYVTVMDMNGKELAHGANKRMQGVDLIDIKDQDGKAYIRERIALVKANGKGWQDYKFVNPVTKSMEPKSMYFEKYEDLLVSCGIYKKP
ncbi:MAG: cache domain-containing protein [Burkholderiaceae bacterium]|nr:cache domain-containing protein [Burkholderiaceae bacterium]